MRLHRLELTAFGPFAETAVVDFDELGADGLFLLHGQTGAGKTTVLDAIAFALYGKVPGARAESKRLHSDHADQQTPPQVLLEATLGGRRLRLIRSPEFQRPSKRAKSGFVNENAAATLEWLDGRGQNLSRIPDIGDEVLRLLGMSADQFFQVVLLPQGDFARFLRADNEDREKLLEKLFDTERFGTAEQWLVDKRKASTADLETRKNAIDRLIAQISTAAGSLIAEAAGPAGSSDAVGSLGSAGSPSPAGSRNPALSGDPIGSVGPGSLGPVEAVGWSRSLLDAARASRTTTAAELARHQRDSKAVRTAAEAERRRHELLRRRTAARAQLADFTATADTRAARQSELDRARRAEPVATALTEARAAAVTLRRRVDDATRAAEQLADRLLEPATAELPGTTWAAADLAAAELAGTDLAADLADIPAIGVAAPAPADRSGPLAGDGLVGRSHPAQPADISGADLGGRYGDTAGNAASVADASESVGGWEPDASAETAPGVRDHLTSPDFRATELVRATEIGGPQVAEHGVSPRDGDHAPGSGRGPESERGSGLEVAVQRWSAQAGSLDEVRADADSATRLTRELRGLRTEQAELDARAGKLATRLTELPEVIAGVEVRLRGAADAAAALPGLEAECQRLRTSATAAVELDRKRAELTRAAAAFDQARAAHEQAWRRTQSLREQRMAGMAGELAGRLVEGEPCTVCGSLAHPDPARPADHAVSKADEDAALTAERKTEAGRERAGQSVAELERAVEVLVERGGAADRAELAAALDDSTRRYTEAQRLAVLVDGLTAELSTLRA
ncbi:AAA family ATPase, partial [Nocardia sp. NPDC004722]